MEDNEPDHHVVDLWPAYLDFYREQVIAGVLGLPEAERRTTRLPSGWTPVELLSHLLHMEQRWFVWGFLGEPVDAPWGDWTRAEPWETGGDPPARWHVPDHVGAEELADRLAEVAQRTRAVLSEHPPETPASPGGRFAEDPPTLEWICFHVLQEYARHAGHLDIAVELAGAPPVASPP